MKHYKVAEARARFGDLLDEAEHGSPVVIERHGVRFTLVAEPAAARHSPSGQLFRAVDSRVMSGQWTWASTARGLRFRARRTR